MRGHGMLMAASGVGGSISAAWRYIRFYITANNGDQYTSIQEIELATTIGGSDITTTTSPTNQDVYFTTNNALFSKAFDNNFTDYANAVYVTDGTALPHWGWIDLSTPQTIVQAKIWPQNYSGGPARAPKNFIVQGSNDATTWTEIKAFSGVTGWVAGTGKTFNLLDGTWA